MIAVNEAWRLYPDADILYAADARWWRVYDFVPEFNGQKWTQDKGSDNWLRQAQDKNLNVVVSKNAKGLSEDPSIIHTGFNSGFQALNLAVLLGAKRVLLVGVDCTTLNNRSHWFDDRNSKLIRKSPYHLFRRSFFDAKDQLKALGVEVINCSPVTTVTCFEYKPLDECL